MSAHARRGPRAVMLEGLSVQVEERAGLGPLDESLPATELIVAHAELGRRDRVLIAPSGYGLLGAWAASQAPDGQVVCADSNLVARQVTRRTLESCGATSVSVCAMVPAMEDRPLDAYLMLLPKGRALARLWLLNGALAVREGGQILLAGANRAGIQSVARDAALLLGPGRLLGYKKGNRLVAFDRPPLRPDALPAEFSEPGLLNGTFFAYEVPWAGHSLTVCTRPGVFSRDGLDDGTRLLLSVLEIEPDDTVLDLGCGAGIIGLVACQYVPASRVTLLDVDSLAVECARETLHRNGIGEARVIEGDGLKAVAGQRYSLIVTNPPFHAGHQVSTASTAEFVHDAYDALLPGGRLVLVANRFLPYRRWLEGRFQRVTTLASDSRYQVLAAYRIHG